MNDNTGNKPVFRNDLTPQTARALLSEEDYVKYSNSHKLYKAGSITFASGMTLLVADFAFCLVELHKPLRVLTGATVQPTNEELIDKVIKSCGFIGLGAALVGGGCMIAGTVRTIKISNNYFKDHPYSELDVSISPSSIGLAYRF